MLGDQAVERLRLPEGVVGRMGGELRPPGQLVQPPGLGEGAGRAGLEEVLVVVAGPAGHVVPGLLLGGLAVEVVEVGLAEGAVVEPVVAHPAVDHRALRHGRLERRVRGQEGHHHRPAVVGRADHANLAVALRQMLDQPVDGVEGVGGVVGGGGIERAARRARHQIGAVRAVLAPHVLVDADVPGLDELLVGQGQRGQQGRGLAALALGGVVGRAGQHDRRALGPLGDPDHREQLHPVAHRDHLLPAHVVVAVLGRIELGGDVGVGRARSGGGSGGAEQDRQQGGADGGFEQNHDHSQRQRLRLAFVKGAG